MLQHASGEANKAVLMLEVAIVHQQPVPCVT